MAIDPVGPLATKPPLSCHSSVPSQPLATASMQGFPARFQQTHNNNCPTLHIANSNMILIRLLRAGLDSLFMHIYVARCHLCLYRIGLRSLRVVSITREADVGYCFSRRMFRVCSLTRTGLHLTWQYIWSNLLVLAEDLPCYCNALVGLAGRRAVL